MRICFGINKQQMKWTFFPSCLKCYQAIIIIIHSSKLAADFCVRRALL